MWRLGGTVLYNILRDWAIPVSSDKRSTSQRSRKLFIIVFSKCEGTIDQNL